MFIKFGLILIMGLLLTGAATTGIGTPTVVSMASLTAIAFLVTLSRHGE
jgi:hypothetical protein